MQANESKGVDRLTADNRQYVKLMSNASIVPAPDPGDPAPTPPENSSPVPVPHPPPASTGENALLPLTSLDILLTRYSFLEEFFTLLTLERAP